MGKSIILRDTSITKDRRLDRLTHFDERSRAFPIRAMVDDRPYKSMYWACNTPALDQGNEGACVGFGVTQEILSTPKEVLGLDATFAREKIYWEAQKIDQWEGGSYPGAAPVYEGTSVLCGIKVAKQLGYVESYRWSFGIDDLILGIGYQGPAVLGVIWTRNMYTPNPKGFIRPSGRPSGGHCILCKGVNVEEEYFVLRNSWGPSWGINGECYIKFKEMKKLLSYDGEALFCIKPNKD